MNGNGQRGAPVNGHMAVASNEAAALQQQFQALEGPVRQVMGTTIRGLLVSCPGIPPHMIITAIAFQVGNLLADAFQADLGMTLQIRKTIRESFEGGMKRAEVKPLPTGPIPNLRG